MRGDYRFNWRGDVLRVVVLDDCVALPMERWAGEGYGRSISVEWLLGNARLPGPKARKEALAQAIVEALRLHHADAPPPPLDDCRCCRGTGKARPASVPLEAP